MNKTAVFPGSFDPFTIGHESIAKRASELFDKIIIAVGYNLNKQGYFPIDIRMKWISQVFENYSNIEVGKFTGMTVEFCKENNASYLLRGLRTASDFEYERAVGQVNKALSENIETVFLLTRPEHTFVQSTIVRDVLINGGDGSKFLPKEIDLEEVRQVIREKQSSKG